MNVILLFRQEVFVKGVLRNLGASGARVHVVTNVRAPAVRLSRFCHRYELIDLPGEPVYSFHFIEWMNRYTRAHGIELVVPADVESARLLSVNRFAMLSCESYPISRKDVLLTLDNKCRFAAFLDRHRIATPRTVVVESMADLDGAAMGEMTFPVIVKPPQGSGGAGAERQETPADLRAYLTSGAPLAALPVVVQEFIEGETVGINILAKDGEIVASTIMREPDPETLVFISDERIEALGRRVAAAARYTGFANIDLRVRAGDGEPFIIECNPRFGFRTWVSMLYGVNFVDIGMRVATGRPLPGAAPRRHGRYVHHRQCLKALLRPWRRAAAVSAESRRGLRLVLSDPLPLIHGLARRALSRLAARLGMARTEG